MNLFSKARLKKELRYLDAEIKCELSEDRKASLRGIRRKVLAFLEAAKGNCDAIVELSFLAGINTKEERDDYFRIKAQCEANDSGGSAWGV